MIDLVTEIKNRVSIMELLDRLNIEVNRAGFIFSPFRNERTASCKIYPETNSFCDMADMTGGSVIDLYMAHYNVETGVAIKELAGLYGISGENVHERKPVNKTVPADRGEDPREAFNNEEKFTFEKRAASIGEAAAIREIRLVRLEKNKEIFLELYYYCLTKGWDKDIYDYLKNTRKIPEYYIERFYLFSIRDYNEVNNHMKKVFKLEDLQRSGLYNKKENGDGHLIFYTHRLIIPHKWQNQIIYLRGRYFTNGSADVPDGANKYFGLKNDAFNLNSPKRFFNIDALANMLKGERLYLVEGEFDTIAGASLKRNFIGIPGAGCLPAKNKFKQLVPFDLVFCGELDPAGSKMLNGHYTDKDGNAKYSEHNIITYLKDLGKEIRIKTLPAKDLNDWIMHQDAA
jgi:DNA primase